MPSLDQLSNVKEFDGTYVILPLAFETTVALKKYDSCPSVPEGFVLHSDREDILLSRDELREMLKEMEIG